RRRTSGRSLPPSAARARPPPTGRAGRTIARSRRPGVVVTRTAAIRGLGLGSAERAGAERGEGGARVPRRCARQRPRTRAAAAPPAPALRPAARVVGARRAATTREIGRAHV